MTTESRDEREETNTMSNTTDSKQGEGLEPCPFCGQPVTATKIQGADYSLVGCKDLNCPASSISCYPDEWNSRASLAEPVSCRDCGATPDVVGTPVENCDVFDYFVRCSNDDCGYCPSIVDKNRAIAIWNDNNNTAAASSQLPAEPPPHDSCSHWREGDSDNCFWCGDDLGPTTEADVAAPAEPRQEGEQEKRFDLDPLEFWCDLAEVLGHPRPTKADVPALVSEVKDRLAATPPETPVVAREFAREWMNTHHASFETNQEREDALAAIITRYLAATPLPETPVGGEQETETCPVCKNEVPLDSLLSYNNEPNVVCQGCIDAGRF